ncbi:hypothetical protein FRC08_007560 [Ceratobasidium sp. 394]|nr:hypothetical protein FRC08_007560 [Ceratobasidium sp. 394]KAG9098497.1 hypothetical protein FS749_003670 [Ceratobasidium sp. UAMH 11750]
MLPGRAQSQHQVMREATLSLQSVLHTLQSNSATHILFPPSDNETSILKRLHALAQTHSNTTAAHALLKKAESWSTLESDVTRLLASSEFDAAADRLASSTTSLRVFERTREYDAAKALMVSLQNQLEAALSTAVVNGVNNLDFEACKRYYPIFCRIQRETEFKYRYNGIRRASLVKLWATYEDTSGDYSFSDFMSKFFGEFLVLSTGPDAGAGPCTTYRSAQPPARLGDASTAEGGASGAGSPKHEDDSRVGWVRLSRQMGHAGRDGGREEKCVTRGAAMIRSWLSASWRVAA